MTKRTARQAEIVNGLPARFWAYINQRDASEGGCWEWTGALSKTGYSRVWLDGKNQQGHRAVFTLLSGPIPEGLQLDHLCRVVNCVNPQHLEPVTARENTLRSTAVAAGNARKTHCINGHPLDAVKMHTDGRERRVCSGCHGPTQGKETHCSNGHEYTEANTRADRDGRRRCRSCARASYHRNKSASVKSHAARMTPA